MLEYTIYKSWTPALSAPGLWRTRARGLAAQANLGSGLELWWAPVAVLEAFAAPAPAQLVATSRRSGQWWIGARCGPGPDVVHDHYWLDASCIDTAGERHEMRRALRVVMGPDGLVPVSGHVKATALSAHPAVVLDVAGFADGPNSDIDDRRERGAARNDAVESVEHLGGHVVWLTRQ